MAALLGPWQCGKTTLARRLTQPMSALEPLRGLVVLDEAPLRPEVFPVLRVLADRQPLPARFLLLGSASPDLVKGVAESLAGRVAVVDKGAFGTARGSAGPSGRRPRRWSGISIS